MNYHSRYAGLRQPVETALVGGGAFGQSLLTQARFIRRLSVRIVVDLTPTAAAVAFVAAGLPKAAIRACETPAEARAAWDAGHLVAAGSVETVTGLPFHILVEATGHPESAARHAIAAIESRRHVLLVTKETDSVAGPMLAKLARDAGVLVAPVDGDQPALLIDLVTWGETLGFDILCAGKSSEYDFEFDRATGLVVSNGKHAVVPALADHWNPGTRALKDVAKARGSVLATTFPLKAVPDLCEMTLVANALDLGPDVAPFHCPVARIPEVASVLSTSPAHGVLSGSRRLDVFHHLRTPDEASFAGGVFIIVRCQDRTSWQVLAEKGHAVSADGDRAMIYLPRHLLGVEAATSILDTAGLGTSAYGDAYKPRMDLVAVATRDLAAGTKLIAQGHHHTIDGVTAEMRPMQPLTADLTAPYYLVADRVLARPVRAGDAIRPSDLDGGRDSVLMQLRRRQDEVFASG